MGPRLLLLCTLVLGTAALATACGSRAPTERMNVILICLDTVRADHLGVYGYNARATTPFLDSLASRSTLFEDASSTAGWTKPSVASFFTGTMPSEHGVYEGSARFELGKATDVLPEEAETLAESFQSRGYRTGAFIKNAQLRPGNGFEQGFDVFKDEVGDARAVRWSGLDWVDEGGADPFFLYLHFLDAHWPYAVPDDYATLFAPREAVERYQSKSFREVRDAIHDGEREFSSAEREALVALYDGSLRYLDDQLRVLWKGLEIRGIAENTIVCVVADHGEEFGEHGRIGHGHGLWENLLRVPWILYVPGDAPVRVTSPVSLLDLYPTLLKTAGIAVPANGLAIDRRAQPRGETRIFAEHKAPDEYQHSLRLRGDKLVRRAKPPRVLVAPDAFPVSVGSRWEAELEHDAEGALVATQLKPRKEDPGELTELKGYVVDWSESGFELGGIRVRCTSSVEVQPSDGVRDSLLGDGRAVKVKGVFREGLFQAERVKLYPLGESVDFEIRGAVDRVLDQDPVLRVSIGGLFFDVDERTAFKDLDDAGKQKPRMTREQVVEWLELGTGASGFSSSVKTFDLERDPAEMSPRSLESMNELSDTLVRVARELVDRRFFSADDRLTLTAETIELLRAVGYAE